MRAAIPARIFTDTSAFYALIDAGDAEHQRAVAVTRANARRIFTTNFVLVETHALVLRRLGRAAAARFLVDAEAGDNVVVRVAATDERRAREIISTYDDKDYTLTDATSFAVMERLRIGEAFTFDWHFAQYGFAVLGPDRA